MPVTALPTNAATIACIGTEAGIGENALMSEATPAPPMRPITAPMRRQRRGLDEELPEDGPLRCAERLANADLASAFGDRDHHDRHDADATDHQTDGGQRESDHEDRAEHLVERLHHALGRDEREVVRLTGSQTAHAPRITAVTSSITSACSASARGFTIMLTPRSQMPR